MDHLDGQPAAKNEKPENCFSGTVSLGCPSSQLGWLSDTLGWLSQ